jgi:hypothetical protein
MPDPKLASAHEIMTAMAAVEGYGSPPLVSGRKSDHEWSEINRRIAAARRTQDTEAQEVAKERRCVPFRGTTI